MAEKNLSALCDLHCAYCSHLHKTRLHPDYQTCSMDEMTLKQYIRQKIDTMETGDVHFFWQDGELISDGLIFLNASLSYNSVLHKVKRLLIHCSSMVLR